MGEEWDEEEGEMVTHVHTTQKIRIEGRLKLGNGVSMGSTIKIKTFSDNEV